MKHKNILLAIIIIMFTIKQAGAQNWILNFADSDTGLPIDTLNVSVGNSVSLYGIIYNTTGTNTSTNGMGDIALPTSLEFGGFGWILNPGQSDLEAVFSPNPLIPGFPVVEGSLDGITPGTSNLINFGTFQVANFEPGTYSQSFVASAYPYNIEDFVEFGDIFGTLKINITPYSTSSAPEPSCIILYIIGFILLNIKILKTNQYSRLSSENNE
ncbi:hypothetical protein [Armatimonas rosea]|uniref:Uncharacterized protein n=1 Tax=Armatimonas rosea TaxID=685828 RepID=A0A7W9SQ35_ARMRO|nr:hypothetical protein [Armatimonas rosea]MBB6050741.1 hypothetical protein [Armatimonas rosea]